MVGNDTHELLADLNPAQREAVQHRDGPLLILAGPGSGKTRVVTHRIAWLLAHDILPQHVLALTFTNKAADEMKVRVGRLVPGRPVWIGTFHSFCARLLRIHAPLVGLSENFSILDADDSRRMLESTAQDMGVNLRYYSLASVAAAVSWAKNELLPPGEVTPSPLDPEGILLERVYPEYQKRLQTSNSVDFDDLLMHVAVLLREHPPLRESLDARFRYILVDEYQDTNRAQYAILRALAHNYRHLAVTGDPDQSIYGWRGATLRNILEFERDFSDVRVVRLEENYRSTKSILRVADRLISHNRRRKDKVLYTQNTEGRPVELAIYRSGRDEAETIAARIANEIASGARRPGDFAIFYRTNALSRTLEQSLRGVGVPYQIVKGLEFYQRKEIKDLLAYLHLVNNSRHDVALERIINVPPRGIGRSTWEALRVFAIQQGMPLLEAARQAPQIERLPKRGRHQLEIFVAMVDRLQHLATAPVEELLGHVLALSGYREWLECSVDPEDQDRLANVEELLSDAREFDARHAGGPPLEAFLERASLVADVDGMRGAGETVMLMTLHAAKGLEFPVVYIVAIEENLLPHERSRADEAQLEEERRLFFVGITRARTELRLSMSNSRLYRGAVRQTVPSSFLLELPREELDIQRAQLPVTAAAWTADFPDDADPFLAAAPSVTAAAAPAAEMPRSAPLRTAAEMLAEMSGEERVAAAIAPDSFTQGMLVQHPQYGPGRIVALSGSGLARTATVRFLGPAGERRFRLAQSPLRPLRSEG